MLNLSKSYGFNGGNSRLKVPIYMDRIIFLARALETVLRIPFQTKVARQSRIPINSSQAFRQDSDFESDRFQKWRICFRNILVPVPVERIESKRSTH